jgi:hypothetical protein
VVNVRNVTNITNIYNYRGGRGFNGIAPLRSGNRYSNLRLAVSDEHIRQAISTVPADHFGTGRAVPTPVSREVFRDGRLMTGNLPIVPTRETLSATNRPASPSTLRGGQQERFYMKSRPAAAPQPFDKQAAQVQQAIQRNGRFAPIRPEARSQAPGLAKPNSMPANGISVSTPQTPLQESKTPMQTKIGRGQAMPTKGVENSGGGIKSSLVNNGWRRFGAGADVAENRPPENPQQSPAKTKAPAQPRKPQPKDAKPAAPNQSDWHRFSDAGRGGDRTARSVQQPENRNARPSEPVKTPPSRPTNPVNTTSPSAEPSPDRNDGWRHFTPQPGSAAPESPNRGNQVNNQWDRFPSRGEPPATHNSREARPPAYGDATRSSRPPLDLKRPIVMPRAPSGAAGPYERGSGGRVGDRRPEPRSGGGARSGSGSSGQSHPPSDRRPH